MTAYSTKLRFLTALALSGALTALAQIPALPAVPEALPSEARQPLQNRLRQLETDRKTLIDDAARHNQQCLRIEKGSAQEQSCIASRDSLGARRDSLRNAVKKLEDDIDAAVVAEKRRLIRSEQDFPK